MKSYTDLEQSKKLTEILPIESADMVYLYWINSKTKEEGIDAIPTIREGLPISSCDIPCWTLAALLNILRTFTTPTAFSVKVSTPALIKTENGYKLTYTGDYTPIINNKSNIEVPIESVSDNAIDCCVNMIFKLNELKML